MTDKEITELLSMASANYRGSVDMKKTRKLWESMLVDYTYDQVRAALKKHMSESRFFPSIAEITQHIPKETKQSEEQTHKPKFSAAEKRAGVLRNQRTYEEIRSGKFRKDKRPVELRLEDGK